jgi:hypothetical protein
MLGSMEGVLLVSVITLDDLLSVEYMAESARLYEEDARRYALTMRYDHKHDAFALRMRGGAIVIVPRAMIPAFRDVLNGELDEIELSPEGGALVFERKDIHVSIPGLVNRAIGAT